MIKISNIRLSLDEDINDIKLKSAKILGIGTEDIMGFKLLRLSLDARRRSDLHYVCAAALSLKDERGALSRLNGKNVTAYEPRPYIFPAVTRKG